MASTSPNSRLVGGIEAGGTKFVCAVGTSPDDIIECRFPTGSPRETLAEAVDFFKAHAIRALAIGTFGPADVIPSSPTFGHIKNTPKPGWAGTDFLGTMRKALPEGLPISFDTDVNAAAVGEHRWGAGQDVDNLIYLTVGTGIGGGIISDGRLVRGLGHPEIGHIRIPHDSKTDSFSGSCPFHGDCLEGLASGTALQKRWGVPAKTLPTDHPAWELEADHLANALINLSLVLSPERIVLGGGVMDNLFLFPMIRDRYRDKLNGYLDHPPLEKMIVPPLLGAQAGISGALGLALEQIAPSGSDEAGAY